MAASLHRASVSSTTTAPDDWDAGVHAESDAGPIDIGLSVEPTALGLVVDAPGVGTLKIAFDVTQDGTTRLARASRRLADGRDVPLVAVDEGQLLKAQGELERLRRTVEALQAAPTASDALAEAQADREAVEAQLTEVRNRAVAEAADARAAVSTLEEQLADTGARVEALEAELASARAMAEAAQGRLQKTEVELTDATLRATALETEREQRVGVEPELAAAKDALGQQLTTLQRQLDTARAALAATEQELARREESLALAVEQRDALQAQLAAVDEAHTAQQRATDEAREVARRLKGQADALLAERDEARAVARQLHQRLSAVGSPGEAGELRAALDAERQIASTLVGERNALAQRVQALEHLVAQERGGRGQALAERDEWRARFQALARGADVTGIKDLSREDTLSYKLGHSTETDLPAATGEPITDPATPKKGP